MKLMLSTAAVLAVVLTPGLAMAQCESGGPIQPCHCLTIEPSAPVVGDQVTVTLFIDGQQMPIGPEFEPICFGAPGDFELCLEDGVTFSDGAITFEWTQDIQDVVPEGWAWVWWAENFFEDNGALAEVRLAELVDDGVGCSSCAGDCDTPPGVGARVPVAGPLGLGLLAAACVLGGARRLRRRRK